MFGVGGAAVLGYAAASLPLVVSVLLTLALSGVVFFVLFRSALTPRPAPHWVPREMPARIPSELLAPQPSSWTAEGILTDERASTLRLPRALYYLGTLLVSELALRPHEAYARF